MTTVVEVDGRPVVYTVRRSQRSTLEIAVMPDQRVVVTAPISAVEARIHAIVCKRAVWIGRQLRSFEELRPLPVPRKYVGGETHRYLGRQYRLRVTRGGANSVSLRGAFLHVVTTAPKSRQSVRMLVGAWYARRAQAVLGDRLVDCVIRARSARLPLPKLSVRPMVRRWGSCTVAGRVTLNVDLVKAPPSCIDYVITHELCHIQYHDHSSDFYRLLEKVMPDWEKRKHKLELALV